MRGEDPSNIQWGQADTEDAFGVKHDEDKILLELVPPELLWAAGRAFTHGAKKYGRRNWERGLEPERLMGALLRHLMAFQSGEVNDPESKLSHLDHAAASLAMLIATLDRRTQCRITTLPKTASNVVYASSEVRS